MSIVKLDSLDFPTTQQGTCLELIPRQGPTIAVMTSPMLPTAISMSIVTTGTKCHARTCWRPQLQTFRKVQARAAPLAQTESGYTIPMSIVINHMKCHAGMCWSQEADLLEGAGQCGHIK